jgi:SAM-dependent methyltransferase
MSVASLVDVNCPVCGSKDSRHLFWTRDYLRRLSEDRFGVRRCLGCGAGFVSPRPSESEIGRFYDEAFYWMHESRGQTVTPGELLAARMPQIEAKAACLAHLPPGRLLDIGAQKGEFLHIMGQRGWTVEGIEYSTRPPNSFNMPMRYGEFLDMDFETSRFDVVTLWAVLEHVYDPCSYISKAATLLKPGGRLLALVTNFNSIQGRYYQADDYPRHLTLFTKASMRGLLERSGLKVRRMWTDQKIFSGSLSGGLVFFTKRLLGYSADEAFTEWKQADDPILFCCKWRGQPSTAIRWISRVDRLLCSCIEPLLDRLGHGFILLVEAERE